MSTMPMHDPLINKVLRWLREDVALRQADLRTWAGKFMADPADRLQWSLEEFANAARVQIFGAAIDALLGGRSIPDLIAFAKDQAMHATLYPSRSTSPTHNLMEQERAAAWARLAAELGCLLADHKEGA